MFPVALKYQRTDTTVIKDNCIAVGAAMRGRYNSDGKTEQNIEVRDDEFSNAITTVQKDTLVIEGGWLLKKYSEFYKKHHYIPKYFCPYNCSECLEYAPTLTANSNTSATHSGTVLIIEEDIKRQ